MKITSFVLLLLIIVTTLSVVSASDDNQTSTNLEDTSIQSDVTDDIKEVQTSNIENTKQKNIKTQTKTVSTYNELKSAMTAVDDNKVINMKKGTYTITSPISLTGKIDNITINGNGAIIDGQNKYQFLTFNGKRNITINDLAIRNTKSTDQAAGIAMTGVSTLKLNNVNFTHNVASGRGGAITNRGELIINNCAFTQNTAQQGGAIWSTGEYGGSVSITNSKFINNNDTTKNDHDRTGVIYALSGGTLDVKNCLFENNNGRCIHNYKDTKATITGNTFKNSKLNMASSTVRGAIIDNYEADMTLNNNIFDNINVTSQNVNGGLIYCEIGNVKIENNIFKNVNTQSTSQTNGGIIFNRNSTTLVNNNTFNNKDTSNKVNGATVYNNIGTITVTNNTFNTNINSKGEVKGSVYNDNSSEGKSTINAGGNEFDNIKAIGSKIFTKEIYNLGILNNITYLKHVNINVKAPDKIATGQNALINITVTNSNNNPIDTRVILKINGLTQKDKTGNSIITVKGGKTTYNLSLAGYSGKTYNVTVVGVDPKYLRSENTTKMTVLRGQCILDPISVNTTSEGEITINKIIKDTYGNVISGNTQIAIKLGDRTVLTTRITDGKLNVKVKVPYLPPGQNKFRIILGENYRYESKIINNTLNIHKQNVTATVSPIKAKAGDKITIKTTLINSETKTNVISGKFSYKLDAKTIVSNTTLEVKNAIAQMDYTLPKDIKAGLHYITIVYAGNTQSNTLRYDAKVLTIE